MVLGPNRVGGEGEGRKGGIARNQNFDGEEVGTRGRRRRKREEGKNFLGCSKEEGRKEERRRGGEEALEGKCSFMPANNFRRRFRTFGLTVWGKHRLK